MQVGTRVTSTRLDSARLSSAGYSGFDSSPFLAQAQHGAPYLDWGINSMLDSAQLGVWLGSVWGQVGDSLGTRDSGFGLAGLGRVGGQFVLFRSEYS